MFGNRGVLALASAYVLCLPIIAQVFQVKDSRIIEGLENQKLDNIWKLGHKIIPEIPEVVGRVIRSQECIGNDCEWSHEGYRM